MRKLLLHACLAFTCVSVYSPLAFAQDNSLLDSLRSVSTSTVPANGDLNPYGVAFVPAGFPGGGSIAPGDVLVSNFNNSSNVQGTGTTIVRISATGQSLFATSSLIGLDTALGVLSGGFVLVGNLPVTNGVPGTGSLQIFDRKGQHVATINDPLLDSPWDLTISDNGSTALVFVSNVLSGTVTRLNLAISNTGVTVTGKTMIGSGFGTAPNSAAVVVGPTGLAYNPDSNVLYVASTSDNEIFAITDAAARTGSSGTGSVVFQSKKILHGPLGLALAPNGNLVTANGDAVNVGGTPNDLVEFTPSGSLVATLQLDGGAAGGAFGIAITSSGGSTHFAAVDDDLNSLALWTLP